MNFGMIVVYILLFCLIALTIRHVHGLKNRYPLAFVKLFFYYIGIYYVWFFLNLTPKLLLSVIYIENIGTLHVIISAITLPLMILSFYLFLLFSERLTRSRLPVWVKRIFWIVQFFLFSIFLMLSVFIADHGVSGTAGFFLVLIKVIPTLSVSIPPVIMCFYTRYISEKRDAVFSKRLGGYYLIAYPLMYLTLEFWEIPFQIFYSQTNAFYLVILIVYTLNVPAIIYMTLFLKKHEGYFSGEAMPDGKRKLLLEEMNITPREWDIIKLILRGRTNPEIGNLLFISTKTVKNNLTEIYRKLNVKNRVQMVRKVSKYLENKE